MKIESETSGREATADRSDDDSCERQLYTPAMLAELLGVSVRTVRRWHRADFLRPVTEIMQLPHFDYAALTTARQLAAWMKQGATVPSIQQQLELLKKKLGDAVPLHELPISADGNRLVLRHGDHLLEATGQLRFGFDGQSLSDSDGPVTLRFEEHAATRRQALVAQPSRELVSRADASAADTSVRADLSLEAMVDEALAAEDDDELDLALEWYRAALAAHGVNSDICFQLAELLYRCGDSSAARERYYMALELNPELVEARANLGCVLAEDGQMELAVAAFRGALEQFADYADVHFHLARALDDLGEVSQAAEHWHRFIELAPASPWAEEAQQRLNQSSPLLDF